MAEPFQEIRFLKKIGESILIKDNQKHFNRLHVVLDALVIIISYICAFYIQFHLIVKQKVGMLPVQTYMSALFFVVPVFLFLYYMFNLYTPKRVQGRRLEASNVFVANVTGMLLFFFMLYMVHEMNFSRQMIGIFIGFMIYTKYFKEDTRMWLMTSVPGIPLFHAFGRMGCTIGGCCYGLPHAHVGSYNEATGLFDIENNPIFNGFSVYNARTGSYHLPIQLIESAGLFAIFAILVVFLIFIYKKKAYYKPMGLYFVLYGILRFVDEFFRGDSIRGIWGPFSTSQYISLFIIPIGIYCLICPTEKNFFEKWYTLGKPKKATEKETGKTEENS